MKKSIFLSSALSFLVLMTNNLDAQFNYGLHAGLNVETQAELGLLWNNVDLYQGFTFGAVLEYDTGNSLSFQTEVNYKKKGEKVVSWIDQKKAVLTREFNYVTVPLLAKYNFKAAGVGDDWKFSLFTGPYAGFLTSVHEKSRFDGTTTSVDINDQAEKNDWGVIFGGGVSKKLLNGTAVTADLRYDMGLSKVDKENPELRNKGFGVVIGYMF
ncbi:MAG: PorT family protein [Bacteroidales bacterium]|nr:PorT family protein [Bacteroidales bacterium]